MMRRAPIRIAVVLASAVLAACTHAERPAPGKPVTTATRIERLSVLTYNVLHGLEVSGWSVGPAESKEEQRTRFNLQARKLSLAQPDVLLLQEVNPLPEKADAYVTALTTSGGQYTEVHQADACGIRLFGLRIIPGLNNGMAILAKAPLRLRKVARLKLSGGFGGCGDFFGLQLGELRYALIAEVENPTTGNKLLAVSVHLHSGIERTSYFLRRIADAEEQGELRREVLQDFVAALEDDQNRRLGEIRVLVKELSRLHAENERYLGAIVGHEEAALLRVAMAGLSEEERQRIAEGYRRGMGQARRIDYLFHMGKPPNIPQECLRQELLGTSAAVVAQPASDHYGVMNTYILDPIQC